MNPLLAALLGAKDVPGVGSDDDPNLVAPDGIGSRLPSALAGSMSIEDIQQNQLDVEAQAAAADRVARQRKLDRIAAVLGKEPNGVGVRSFKDLSRGQKAASIIQALADIGAGSQGVESRSLERTAGRNLVMDENWKNKQIQLADLQSEDAVANSNDLRSIAKLKTTFALSNAKDAREVVAELMRTDSEAFYEMYGGKPGEDPSVAKQKVDELVGALPGMSEQDRQRLMVFMANKVSEGRSKYKEAVGKERDMWANRVSQFMDNAPPGTPNPLYERVMKGGKLDAASVPIEYQQLFERIGSEEGVDPAVLAAMAKQESNFDPHAQGEPTKYGTALGMMQLLPSNASKAGIDPFNPEQAVRWAARYIKQAQQSGYTSDQDIGMFYHGGPDTAQWGPLTQQHGEKVAQLANQFRGLEGTEPDTDGMSALDSASTKEQVSEVGRRILARASELAQRARNGNGGGSGTPEEKEAKQLRMKLASYGGSIDILTDEERNNPYFLQPLVGAHAELQSKDRKGQADAAETWQNALNEMKDEKAILAYALKNKITDGDHLRNYLLGTASAFVNGSKPDPTKGRRGSPRLVGTYALGVERNTDKWLEEHSRDIETAMMMKEKLGDSSGVPDKEAEKLKIEAKRKAGEISDEQASKAKRATAGLPNVIQIAQFKTKEQILESHSVDLISAGVRTDKLSPQEARKRIKEIVADGFATQETADKALAVIDEDVAAIRKISIIKRGPGLVRR